LEDRTFCEAELRSEILDARRMVALLGKVSQRCIDNSRALGFESRTRLGPKAHGRLE
jgi:hypothetical protein